MDSFYEIIIFVALLIHFYKPFIVPTFQELISLYTTDASRFLPIDDMLVHYRDEGTGPVLVLIHGAFSSLHTYNDWAAILKKHYRVIRLDMMGFGLTGQNSSGDYSMGNHVRVLKRFLNILDIKECHIAGSSLGGWLAWEFTRLYPKRVEKLILIDAAGYIEPQQMPLPFKLAQSMIPGRVFRYAVRKSILEQFVKQVYYDLSKVNTKLVQRYYDLFTRKENLDAFAALVKSPFRNNSALIPTIENPTLILWGEEDNWIPLEHGYRFHKALPNSTFITYSKTGHLPMEELPVPTSKDLIDFLEA